MRTPFSLQEWLRDRSRKVVTSFGETVTIINWEAVQSAPVVGLVNGIASNYRADGKSLSYDEDPVYQQYLFFEDPDPKFKIGDTVTYKKNVYKITDVSKHSYTVEAIFPLNCLGTCFTIIGMANEKCIEKVELTMLEQIIAQFVNKTSITFDDLRNFANNILQYEQKH